MSAKLTKILKLTPVIFCMGGVLISLLFQSCGGGSSSAFVTNLRNFSSDKNITEAEYASLKGFLSQSQKGYTIGQATIKTESDLIDYLHSTGITGSASALAITPPVTFDTLQVYLENSASMKGYSNAGNPQFTAPIIALFNTGDQNTQIVTGYVGGSSSSDAVISPEPRTSFESNLANGRIATAVSSPLDKILSLVADATSETTVSCIITDGILSGSNQEIAADRDFTIKNLPLLEQRIRDAVKKVRIKGLETVIYRMETSFSGTYFDYRNAHHQLSDEERPYYMIFFGHQTNLEKVQAKLEREHSFDYEDVLISYEMERIVPIQKAHLITMPGTAEVNVMTAKSLVQIKGSPAVPVDFRVRLAMQNLPSYYSDEDLMEERMRFGYTDEAYSVDVDKSEFIQSIKEADSALRTIDVIIQLAPDFISSFSGIRKCHLTLPGFADPWYLEHSTEDDTDIDDDGSDKTFALKYFIGGIMSGMEVQIPEKSVDVEIILQKQ